MQNNITEESLKNGFKLILKTELNLNYIFAYCELLGRLNGKYNVYKFNDDVIFIEGGTFGLNLDNGLNTIDGRWSIKNPKYVEAKKHNDKINEFINEKRKEIDKEIKQQKDKLQQCNLVSSTMWHCKF